MDKTLQQILQVLIDQVREIETLKQEILLRDEKLKALTEIEKA